METSDTSPRQAREPSPAKKKVRGRPEERPENYNRIVIYTGTSINRSCTQLEEVHRDKVIGKSWDDLGREARLKYANRPIHFRAYGGPERVAWYCPPTYSFAENIEDGGVALGAIDRLTQENADLKMKIADLQRMIADLQKREPMKPIADEGEEEIEEEETDPVTDFMNDLVESGVLPMLKDKIRGALGIPPGAATAPGIADNAQPMPPDISDTDDGYYDIPTEVLEFFDKVDWKQTDYTALLAKLQAVSSIVGIVMK